MNCFGPLRRCECGSSAFCARCGGLIALALIEARRVETPKSGSIAKRRKQVPGSKTHQNNNHDTGGERA